MNLSVSTPSLHNGICVHSTCVKGRLFKDIYSLSLLPLAAFPHFHVLSSLAKGKCFQSQLDFFAPTFDDFKSLISDYVPFT